jgi:hypothetical protein
LVGGAGGGLQVRSAGMGFELVRSCRGARLGAACQRARSRKHSVHRPRSAARVRREVERRKGGLDGALSRIGNPLTGKLRSEVEAHVQQAIARNAGRSREDPVASDHRPHPLTDAPTKYAGGGTRTPTPFGTGT